MGGGVLYCQYYTVILCYVFGVLGCDIPAQIVTPGTTVRGLLNMTAITVARLATQEG